MSIHHIIFDSYASFASNKYRKSQFGYIIQISENYNNAFVLSQCSRKYKRIVHALSAALDQFYAIWYYLQLILDEDIGLIMFTDSRQLFAVMTEYAYTTEKATMVEIMVEREAYNLHEIFTWD